MLLPLTNAEMSVQTGVSGSASQILASSVANVLPRLWFTVSLGKAKVDNIYKIPSVAKAH